MSDLKLLAENIKKQIKGGLIVSCQAPQNSPLYDSYIIAAMARTAEINGAAAVRIDSPKHISAVKKAIEIPIFGIYKILSQESEVYITPTLEAAQCVAEAGANVIAVDATSRERPGGESLEDLCRAIQNDLRLSVMADVATVDEGVRAAEELGCDFISTTLSGYTKETLHLAQKPDFLLVENLSKRLSVPVICEGRLHTPLDARRAFESGAFAVVIGKAITGIDALVSDFAKACVNSYEQISVG